MTNYMTKSGNDKLFETRFYEKYDFCKLKTKIDYAVITI